MATGIYLAQLYDPTPTAAHSSVVDITASTFGSLVRSLHFWLSSIFLVTLAFHLLRTFATAAYKAPREGIWLTGIGLFLLACGLLFTGTPQVAGVTYRPPIGASEVAALVVGVLAIVGAALGLVRRRRVERAAA